MHESVGTRGKTANMKQIEFNKSSFGTILFLTYSFFLGLFVRFVPTSVRIVLLLVGLLCFFSTIRFKKGKQPITVVLAIICFFIVLFNRNARFAAGDYGIDVCVMIGLSVYCLAYTMNNWHQTYYKYLLIMGVFYGLTTIFLFLFPQIYLRYVFPLFGTQRGAILAQKGYAVGFSPHYSITAMYLVAGASAAIIPLLRGKDFDKDAKRRLILLFILVYVSILLTGKRAHSVFMIFAGVITYWLLNKDKKQGRLFYLIVGLSVFIVIFLIASYYYPPLYNVMKRFEVTISEGNLLTGRDKLILECIEMFESNPLFGTGWGSYTVLTASRFIDAHNVYVQLLAENGIILSIPFYAFFIANWIHAARAGSRLSSRGLLNNWTDTAMIGVSLLFQIFFLFYCLTGNPLYDTQVFFPYIFACAIGEYYYQTTTTMISEQA